MKRIVCALLVAIILSGCSNSTVFNYDIGSKALEDVVDSDAYKNITSDMKLSEVLIVLGNYDNYFEGDKNYAKTYEFNLDEGVLQAVVELSDDTWYTSYIFKPFQMNINSFFKETNLSIGSGVETIYIKQSKDIKLIILLKGNRIDEIILH